MKILTSGRSRSQSLDLLARAGARREQHDTLGDDRKVPTHSRGPVIAEERDTRPAHNTVTGTTFATPAPVVIRITKPAQRPLTRQLLPTKPLSATR